MQKVFTLFLFLSTSFGLTGQTVVDFENFNLAPESFLNGSDSSGGFSFDDIFLPNDYNFDWNSWNGWAVSNTTDVTTPGVMNQYSSIAGKGAGGSDAYATSYVFGETVIKAQGNAVGKGFKSMMINNATYTYLSMKDGDSVAKKFGGETGDDPDYLLLTIKARTNDVLSDETIEFYLADYRFSDNSMDYIVDEWTHLDLDIFGAPDELVFTISGSDIGQFGLNTPAYFCVDNIETRSTTSTENLSDKIDLTVFPNPTTDFLTFDWNNKQGTIEIITLGGQVLQEQNLQEGKNVVNVSALATGLHLLKIITEEGYLIEKIIKK